MKICFRFTENPSAMCMAGMPVNLNVNATPASRQMRNLKTSMSRRRGGRECHLSLGLSPSCAVDVAKEASQVTPGNHNLSASDMLN